MFRNGDITYEGIGGLDFREILKEERARRGWMKPLVPAVSIPPPSPKVAETRPKKVDKKKTPKTPIVMEEDVDDVEEMEPPLEEPESPVVDEREEQIQPEVPSPDKETSESPESEELDYDLEDVMDVVNGNVDFGEDSEEEEENGTAVEEERRKKNAEKWLRGAKRIWDAAFSDESATSEEETDDRAELCEGPAKRKKVVTRTNSVKFYEEKYVEMHSFGKPRGGEGWWICKADARFAKRSYKAKRRSYGVPHCTNCGMKKHTATKCPEPQKRKGCIVCDSDRHKAQSLAKCPSKICHRCLGTDHDPQGCPGVKSKCQICKTWNHVESACTDFWRRFHQTTSGIIPIAASLTGSPLPKKFLWTSLRLVHSYAPVVGKKPAGLPKSKSAPSSLNKMVETPKQEQRSQEAADDEESPLLLEEEDEEIQVVPPPPRKVNVVTVDSDDNPTDDDEKVFLLSDSDCEDPNSDVQRMLNAGIVGTSAGAAANSSNGANQPQNQWNDVNGGQSPQVQNFTRRVEGEEMVFEVRGNRGAGGGFRGKNRHSRGFPRSPVNQDSGSGGRPPRGTPRGNKRRPWGVSRGGSSGPAQNGQRSNSQGQQLNEATGNRGGFRGGRGGFRGAGRSAPNGQRPNFQGHQANEAAGNRGGFRDGRGAFRGGRGGFRGGRGARGNAANGSQNRGISGGSGASWRGSTPRGGNSGSDGSVRWNGRKVGKNR